MSTRTYKRLLHVLMSFRPDLVDVDRALRQLDLRRQVEEFEQEPLELPAEPLERYVGVEMCDNGGLWFHDEDELDKLADFYNESTDLVDPTEILCVLDLDTGDILEALVIVTFVPLRRGNEAVGI